MTMLKARGLSVLMLRRSLISFTALLSSSFVARTGILPPKMRAFVTSTLSNANLYRELSSNWKPCPDYRPCLSRERIVLSGSSL